MSLESDKADYKKLQEESREWDLFLRTETQKTDNSNKAFQAAMKQMDRGFEAFMTAVRTGAKITGGN